ncbi:MAG: CDGSH iron-sulfur domain-containing protein [Bacteroidota bacterium]
MAQEKSAQFKVIKNGPLLVEGNFQLKDSNGNIMNSSKRVHLCRCGKSGNLPFCDGSHAKLT